ncbi:hypothetical protein GCM10027592_13560 [Spirosoma flavus]
MENIVIIVPVYKKEISFFEKKSLSQCLIVLKKYDICIVHPDGLDVSYYDTRLKKAGVNFLIKAIDSQYFQGIDGYNRLMLSVGFYQQFTDYNFLLLYQLDAYIFKDQISEWCNKNYTLVGAPIHEDILKIIRHKYFVDFNTKLDQKIILMNGGFSLRHIQTIIKVLQYKEERIQNFLNKSWPEDMILAILLSENKYKLPDKKEALTFAFEAHPRQAYKANAQQLPTGCHAWYRNDFGIHDNNFWFKKIIPLYYYKTQFLDHICYLLGKYTRRANRIINYFRSANTSLKL